MIPPQECICPEGKCWKTESSGSNTVCRRELEATESHATSGQTELVGCATGKLNKISDIVDDMLRHLKETPKMNVNGTDYIDLHCMRTTLEDINRELCK